MIRSVMKRDGTALAALLLTVATAAAVELPPATAYDTAPRDGLLSPQEQRAYEAALLAAQANGADADAVISELFRLRDAQRLSGDAAIRLADLGSGPGVRDCSGGKQPFYLRRKVIGVPVLGCDGLGASANGASFGFDSNRISGNSALTFDFGLAVPLFPDAPPRDPSVPRGGLSLTDYGVAAFVQGNGTVRRNAANSGTVKSGLLIDAVYEGTLLTYVGLNTSAYYMNYLDGGGSALGVSATWTPVDAGLRLNSAPGGRENTAVMSYVTASVEADVHHVLSPGNTGFTTGDNFAWAIANLGYLYADERIGPHGAKFEVGGKFAYDLGNSRDAILWSAGIALYLDEFKRTSLDLKWQKGTNYETMKSVDSVNLGLSIKF